MPSYDPNCYLCPGNTRAQGEVNPTYKDTFTFVNDYSAVKEDQKEYVVPDRGGGGGGGSLLPPRNSKFFPPDSKKLATGMFTTTTTSRQLLLRAEAVTGKCYVMTFSPSHNLTVADFGLDEIVHIIESWTRLYRNHLSPLSPLALASSRQKIAAAAAAASSPSSSLPPPPPPPPTNQLSSSGGGSQPQPQPQQPQSQSSSMVQYRYMQIFENKGAAMGCSNPHPHGQVWITSSLPEELSQELAQLQNYRKEQGGGAHHLLEDYASLESEEKERVVFENKMFLALCPWWAIWPFEVMIVAKQHKRALVDLDRDGQICLAEAISEVTRRYDNLFETHFPYSMGIHQAPLEGTDAEIEASHLHIHYYPPLLRSATVKKFLVG